MFFKVKKSLAKTLTSMAGAICLSLFVSKGAYASFVDTDTFCINYGCVVTSDNNTTNVYDEYRYTSPASPVPVGGQLVFYTENPVSATTGTVDPLFTNTNTNISTMAAGQGNRIRITNGLGVANPLDTTDTNANGLLDASDTIQKFGIQAATKIDYFPAGATATLGANPQSHSFYLSSRNVSFNIRAQSSLDSSSGEFPVNVPGSTIAFTLNMTRTGTNGGTAFGANTVANPGFVNIAGLEVSDLSTNPIVAYFTGANIYATANAGANIQTKSVRMEAVYTLPAFSLSQGSGQMQWSVDFTFWRRS